MGIIQQMKENKSRQNLAKLIWKNQNPKDVSGPSEDAINKIYNKLGPYVDNDGIKHHETRFDPADIIGGLANKLREKKKKNKI